MNLVHFRLVFAKPQRRFYCSIQKMTSNCDFLHKVNLIFDLGTRIRVGTQFSSSIRSKPNLQPSSIRQRTATPAAPMLPSYEAALKAM